MSSRRKVPREKYRPTSARLLDQVREVLRYHHYAIRTEEAYVRWILRYIRFNGTRHPREEFGVKSCVLPYRPSGQYG